MKNQSILPVKLTGIKESIYAGFWIRVGAGLLDLFITLPIIFTIIILNSLKIEAYFFTIIPNLIFFFYYNIYLVKKYGGTPGKLISDLKIIKIDGNDITWNEAILRESVMFLLQIFIVLATIISISEADAAFHESLSWINQTNYIKSISPLLFGVLGLLINVWVYSEFLVIFFNKRKRSIHDYIAGTVVVRKEYLNDIKKEMNLIIPISPDKTLIS